MVLDKFFLKYEGQGGDQIEPNKYYKTVILFKDEEIYARHFLSIVSLVIEQYAVSRFILISIFIRLIRFLRINKYVYIITLALC